MSCTATTQWTTTHGTLLLAVSLAPKEIGQRIAEARKAADLTQLSFALLANVSPSSVARWESGKLPPVRELMRIADLLGVEAETFVEPPGSTPPDDERLGRLESQLETVLGIVQDLRDELVAQREQQEAQPAARAQR